MSTRNHTPARGRPAAESAGMALLAILSLSNLAAVTSRAPVFAIVIAVALAVAGVAAIAGCWTRRPWGRWAGAAVALASAVSVAPGIFLAPSGPLRYALAAVVVIGIACAALMLAGRGTTYAEGRE